MPREKGLLPGSGRHPRKRSLNGDYNVCWKPSRRSTCNRVLKRLWVSPTSSDHSFLSGSSLTGTLGFQMCYPVHAPMENHRRCFSLRHDLQPSSVGVWMIELEAIGLNNVSY
jgi:hypothetical protein